MSPAELKAASDSIAAARLESAARLSKISPIMSLAEQQEVIADFLGSSSARLVSVLDANLNLHASSRCSLERCLKIAQFFSLDAVIAEPVCVYPRFKSNGGFRVIQEFGILHM